MCFYDQERLFQQTNLLSKMVDSSFSSSEPLGLVVRDRLNIRGKIKCPPLEKEVVVRFDDDNCLVVTLRLVDTRFITSFLTPKW